MRTTAKQQGCGILSPGISCLLMSTAVSLLLLGSPGVAAAGQCSEAVANSMQERDIGVDSNACCDYSGCVQAPTRLPQ